VEALAGFLTLDLPMIPRRNHGPQLRKRQRVV